MAKKSDPLAARAHQAHRKASSAHKNAIKYAVICGEALLKKKDQLEHGDFERWIMGNCDFSVRSAQDYMRIAKSPKAQRAADLAGSIREALDQMREPMRIVSSPGAKPAVPIQSLWKMIR